jgi:hypothetical protein
MIRSVSRQLTKVQTYRAFSTAPIQTNLFDRVKEKVTEVSENVMDKAASVKESIKETVGATTNDSNAGRANLSESSENTETHSSQKPSGMSSSSTGVKPTRSVDHEHWDESFTEKDENFTTTHANAFRDDTKDYSQQRKEAGKPLVWDQDAKKRPEDRKQATMRMGEEKLWREGRTDEIRGRDSSAK